MTGKVVNIYTNVVEVEFEKTSSDLVIDHILKDEKNQNILQIKKILSDTKILAIVIDSFQPIKIGDVFENTQYPLLVPVGNGAKNNVFGIKGNALTQNLITEAIRYIPMNSITVNKNSLKVNREIIETGIKAIDFFIPILKGYKLGILGGAGVGKTVLMKEIIFNSQKTQGQVSSIFIGSGERSREGLELYHELLESNLMHNTIMYISQMNEAPGARMNIVPFGITSAEYLRDFQNETVFLFIDNIYRYIQGANEVSSSLGNKPSVGGYQSTLDSDVAAVQDRLTATEKGSITAFETVFLPMDDLTDPAAVSIFSHLDSALVLSREYVEKNLYPAFDPLASNASSVNFDIIGEEHFNAIIQAKSILQKYKELEDVILILGFDELDEENKVIVEKALQLQNFFTQRFFVAEAYTKEPGIFVPLKDTVRSVLEIINGKYKGVRPEKFNFIGSTNDLQLDS